MKSMSDNSSPNDSKLLWKLPELSRLNCFFSLLLLRRLLFLLLSLPFFSTPVVAFR